MYDDDKDDIWTKVVGKNCPICLESSRISVSCDLWCSNNNNEKTKQETLKMSPMIVKSEECV